MLTKQICFEQKRIATPFHVYEALRILHIKSLVMSEIKDKAFAFAIIYLIFDTSQLYNMLCAIAIYSVYYTKSN